MPLHRGVECLKEPLVSHVVRLAGHDGTEETGEGGNNRITFAEHHARLYRIATGWLGWEPATAWSSTASEIIEAYAGRVELLTAIFGDGGAKSEDAPTHDPVPGAVQRQGSSFHQGYGHPQGRRVMPFAAPSICGCGRAIPSGHRCSCRIVAHRERTKAHDAKRGSARSRGYDSKWDRERAAFLKLNPTCQLCPAPATVVDHKTPHKGDMGLFWNRSNWQGLCAHCHSSTKQRIERGAAR